MKVGILLFLLFGVAWGHMAVYVPSMWGSEPNHPNSNWAVIPLQDMTFEQWVDFFIFFIFKYHYFYYLISDSSLLLNSGCMDPEV